MNRAARLALLWTAIGVAAIAGALALAWHRLVPSDEEVLQQIVAQAEARLGIEVTIRSAHCCWSTVTWWRKRSIGSTATTT